jgi:hypothetical protein
MSLQGLDRRRGAGRLAERVLSYRPSVPPINLAAGETSPEAVPEPFPVPVPEAFTID